MLDWRITDRVRFRGGQPASQPRTQYRGAVPIVRAGIRSRRSRRRLLLHAQPAEPSERQSGPEPERSPGPGVVLGADGTRCGGGLLQRSAEPERCGDSGAMAERGRQSDSNVGAGGHPDGRHRHDHRRQRATVDRLLAHRDHRHDLGRERQGSARGVLQPGHESDDERDLFGLHDHPP